MREFLVFKLSKSSNLVVSEGCFSSSLNVCAINAPKKSSLSSLLLLALVTQSQTCNRSSFPLSFPYVPGVSWIFTF